MILSTFVILPRFAVLPKILLFSFLFLILIAISFVKTYSNAVFLVGDNLLILNVVTSKIFTVELNDIKIITINKKINHKRKYNLVIEYGEDEHCFYFNKISEIDIKSLESKLPSNIKFSQ